MSEIVKVDGAWHINKSQKAEFVREYLVPYLKAQVDKRNLKGDYVSLAREGFGKIFIDGQEKAISNVRRLFRSDKNPNFKDLEKNKVVKRNRAEGQYGFNEETVKQILFLDDVEKLKTEYKENRNPDAGKIFDKKMSALFKKYYRGRIKYDPTKTYGWPKGKSLDGYRKWQRYVYNRLKTEGKHIGHGKPVAQGGTNSASNLALEDPTSNMSTGSKEGTFRPDEELERVFVSHGKSYSLQEYLAFEDDENILTPMDLLPEDHSKLLQNIDEDPEAIFSQGLDNKLNQPYKASLLKDQVRESNIFKDSSNVFDKENGFIDNAKGTAKYLVEESVNATVESYTGIPNVTSLFKGSKKLIEGDARGLLDIAPNLRQTTTTPYRGLQASIR
jgi:hypothetical protein